jgi:hypothetical protein
MESVRARTGPRTDSVRDEPRTGPYGAGPYGMDSVRARTRPRTGARTGPRTGWTGPYGSVRTRTDPYGFRTGLLSGCTYRSAASETQVTGNGG